LLKILEGVLRLLHPLMPFVTEEIWQKLPLRKKEKSIMISEYPTYNGNNVFRESTAKIDLLKDITYGVRNIRGELRVPPELRVSVLIRTKSTRVIELLKEMEDTMKFLARVEKIEYGSKVVKPEGSASAVGTGYELYLPLKGLIDIERERVRLQKELERLESEIMKCRTKLENDDFLSKAPSEIIAREEQRLESHDSTRRRVSGILTSLG
jgi:valyl-tRNA synthetase